MPASKGGWTPRGDRVSGPIVHLRPSCPDCGVDYADVKAGRAEHGMAWHHSSLVLPPLASIKFDVQMAIDTATPRALRSNHEHT